MSVDYKAMSQQRAIEPIDMIPSWSFWRDGCYLFAKNMVTVMERSGILHSEREVVAFLRSLPLDASYLSNPSWKEGFCSKCLQKAWENTPEADWKEFESSVMDYFLYYFVDRDRVSKFMLIDAFIGFVTAIAEAAGELKEGGSGEPTSVS